MWRRTFIAGAGLIAAGQTAWASSAARPLASIPAGYVAVATQCRVPPAYLFGIALQESAQLFGEPGSRRALPWPWTLNIAGEPVRCPSRHAAHVRALAALRAGVESIDLGPMGINWRFHKARLQSVERGLDPYWNLRVGALLLVDHFTRCGNWFQAIGRYHSPANPARAASYAMQVLDRVRRLGDV